MTITPNQNRTSFNDLAALLTGQLVLYQDAAYESVRLFIWSVLGKVASDLIGAKSDQHRLENQYHH
jgi:hypothetical protein